MNTTKYRYLNTNRSSRSSGELIQTVRVYTREYIEDPDSKLLASKAASKRIIDAMTEEQFYELFTVSERHPWDDYRDEVILKVKRKTNTRYKTPPRKTGNTEYILRAAMDNPKCTILCRDQRHADQLKRRYEARIDELHPSEKMKKFLKNEEKPLFVGSDRVDALSGIRQPILVDNSAIKNLW